MTVAELKRILDTMDDDTVVVINDSDYVGPKYWPILYADIIEAVPASSEQAYYYRDAKEGEGGNGVDVVKIG